MVTPLIHGLPPIIGPGARTLILGNMPSVLSLAARQYYGNPRNAFWRIMSEIVGGDPAAPYPDRVTALIDHRIAVWDVLASCRRPGSLDSAVRPDSMVGNDFAALYAAHPQITTVLFNGAAAEQNYRRLIRVDDHTATAAVFARLPSTSPAQTMRYADKAAAWRAAPGLRR